MIEGFRLLAVTALVAAVMWLVAESVENFKPNLLLPTLDKEGNSNILPGLSPALAACYATESTISPLVISVVFGLTLGLMYFFGNFVYKKFRDSVVEERQSFFRGVSKRLESAKTAELAEVINSFSEYEKLNLDRRNFYWGLFLRAALAALVVSLIALLMSVCKIEAQAGLPIITGIIAFVIGQGAEGLHGSGPVVVLRKSDDEGPKGKGSPTSVESVNDGSSQ